MFRDRTNLFLSYRQSYTRTTPYRPTFGRSGYSKVDSEEESGLLNGGGDFNNGDAVIEMDVLPPAWIDIQDEVNGKLAEIKRISAQLDKLHQKHVLPSFEDERIQREEEAAIERLTREITRGFHECQLAIKRIEKMVRDAREQGSLTGGDESFARNMQIALATKVQDESAAFRKKQSTYLKKLRALDGITTPVPGVVQSSPYNDPSMMESETDKQLSQQTLQQTQLRRRINQNDSAIVQREKEINDIAHGIIELADIFKDLQTMVIDQGTLLDRIDYNVERMNRDVKEAQKELVVATGYQKKTTKRKIILLLLLIMVGMIVVLVVKPKRSGEPSLAAPVQALPPPVEQAPPPLSPQPGEPRVFKPGSING